MDSSTTVFIDFDDTLFDYTQVVNWLLEELSEYGISKQDWDETYAEVKEEYGIYKREEHYSLMSARASKLIDKSLIHEKYLEEVSNFIFKDTIRFLEKYKSHDIYIISYGETEYQRDKIFNTDIVKYVKDVVITSGNKADVINAIDYKRGIFIDDKVDNLNDVLRGCSNVQTILIDRRGDYKSSNITVHKIITNLDEL